MRVGRIDRKSHFSVALITCYFGLRRFVYTRRIDLLRPCRADVPLTSRKASAGAFCMWRGSRRWLPLGRALESASTGTPPEEACHSACNIGSDSLLMKFKRRLVLVSQRNQYDAAS